MNNYNISKVVRSGLCTGCGTCIALCPRDAIELSINDKKGIYVPRVDEEKCNSCSICIDVCPGHEVDFEGLNFEIFGKEPDNFLIGNYNKCYVGYSTDYNIRYNSTSGGMITQLLIYALEKGLIDGALVTRMKRDCPLEPEPFIAKTKEEIIEASKSKYCPVPLNIAIKDILVSGDEYKFAVVGLPCHIHGIRKAERINKELRHKIVLHLGIVCNHTPTFLATKFVLKKLKININDIVKLNYRGEGWPGAMRIDLKNDRLLLLGDFWASGFGQGFLPVRCTLCCDHTAELSDISFADAWIPEIKMNDKIGTSIIIVRKEYCDELLGRILNESSINLMQVGLDKVLQSQRLNFKKKDLKARMDIFNILRKKTPYYKVKVLPSSTWRGYLSGIELYVRLYIYSKYYMWNTIYLYQSVRSRIVKSLLTLIQRFN